MRAATVESFRRTQSRYRRSGRPNTEPKGLFYFGWIEGNPASSMAPERSDYLNFSDRDGTATETVFPFFSRSDFQTSQGAFPLL